MKPPQCKTLGELLPYLEKWEDAVRHMNADNQPPPLIKMGIVISMCPPKLQDHLQDMEERLTTYAQLRAEIIRKVDLAEMVKDHRSGSGGGRSSNDMDIGSLQQQNSDPWNYPHHDLQPEQWDQPWSSQDNWSPMNGEVDQSALQKGFKGKGKGKGEYKGKGKGTWGPWNLWNQFNKGDQGGMKGDKGGKASRGRERSLEHRTQGRDTGTCTTHHPVYSTAIVIAVGNGAIRPGIARKGRTQMRCTWSRTIRLERCRHHQQPSRIRFSYRPWYRRTHGAVRAPRTVNHMAVVATSTTGTRARTGPPRKSDRAQGSAMCVSER